jgi:iron complex outermembrane receptor protein
MHLFVLRPVLLPLGWAVAPLLLASPLFSQVTPPPPAVPDDAAAAKTPVDGPPPDKAVVLNPFLVSTKGDVGYLAQNSLAGSRLNSNLGDIAAPTSAFTQEFLNDTAVTSVDELSLFMPSTQIVYPASINLFIANDGATSNTRGLPASINTVNFFATPLRLDTYNVERADQARGPNSILFGLGSPGGVVNVTTNRAVIGRNFGSVTGQDRSYDSVRTALDDNIAVVPDKVSVRLDAVKDNRNTYRDHEYDNQDRIYGTVQWRVNRSTEVSVEYEHGIVNKSIEQPSTAQDGITPWIAAGSKLSAIANPAAAVKVLTAAPYLSVDPATGQATNIAGETVSVPLTVSGTQAYLTDFHLLPKAAALYAGVAFPYQTNYTHYTAFIDHEFGSDFSVELAANDRTDNHNAWVGRGYTLLQVDTDPVLPGGAINPHAGQPFISGFPGTAYSDNKAETIRLSAAFKHDYGIFGAYEFAVLGERELTTADQGQQELFLNTNPYNLAAPDNTNNLVHWRSYLNLSGPTPAIGAGDWRKTDLTHLVDQTGVVRTANWLIAAPGSGASRTARNSEEAVLQGHWLKNHLVAVFGYRKDNLLDWESTTTRTAPYGGFTTGALQVRAPAGRPVVTNAYNNTESGVLRLTNWFGLTYNRAENSSLPIGNFIVSDIPPNSVHPPGPKGKSQDVGFKVELGHRLSLTAEVYQTSATNNTTALVNGPESGFNTIWTALGAANLKAPDGRTGAQMQSFQNEYTFDSTERGEEVELIANPTDNWRIYGNISDGQEKEANIGLAGLAYFAKYQSFWLSEPTGRVLLDDSGGLAPTANPTGAAITTVAQEVAAIQQQMYALYILPNGQTARGDIKIKSYLRTDYSFSQGFPFLPDVQFLRGLSVGAGCRYHSGEVVNYDLGSGTSLYGRPSILFDLNAAYAGRAHWLGRKFGWSVQLNVNNVNNETFIFPMYVINGQVINYRLQPPREFILTTKIQF